MKCKSIRIDFPVKRLSVSNKQLLDILSWALAAHAAETSNEGEARAAAVMAASACHARVDEYDDRDGGPVFYIP